MPRAPDSTLARSDLAAHKSLTARIIAPSPLRRLRPANHRNMVYSRASLAALVLAVILPALPPAARANLPDYRIGDIVREDIFAPAPLSPAQQNATTTGPRPGSSQDVPIVVRFNPKSPDEAEISLRAAIIMARYNFLRVFQEQLLGRKPTEADLGSPAYTRTVAEVSRNSAPYFPFGQLSSLWVSGQSEETLVLTLAQPIRQAMANIIVDDKGIAPLQPNSSLRLITVKNLAMPLGIRDLDGPGLIVSQSKTISLTHARQLVESSFPATQPGLARFAATFVRTNTQPDPAASALLQNRPRQEAVTGISAQSGQIVVRKGQVVDRQVLDALASLREKYPGFSFDNPVPTPQTRPASRPPLAAVHNPEPASGFFIPGWIFLPVAGVFAGLAGFLWIKRARKNTTRDRHISRRRSAQDDLVIVDDNAGPPWQERTRLAGARADRAHEAIRSGVLTWMKDKFVSTLFRHRTELLAAQHKAQAEMEQLERRLEQLHAPLQQRIQAYEKRIAELEEKLANKGEENRHLLGARIQLARQQLERSRFESN